MYIDKSKIKNVILISFSFCLFCLYDTANNSLVSLLFESAIRLEWVKNSLKPTIIRVFRSTRRSTNHATLATISNITIYYTKLFCTSTDDIGMSVTSGTTAPAPPSLLMLKTYQLMVNYQLSEATPAFR